MSIENPRQRRQRIEAVQETPGTIYERMSTAMNEQHDKLTCAIELAFEAIREMQNISQIDANFPKFRVAELALGEAKKSVDGIELD